MDEAEDTPPFATRVGRLLHERYGSTNAAGRDYLLDHHRLQEAGRVEEFAWAFRVSETLKSHGPTVGVGRIDPAGPPRLAETFKPRHLSRWGLREWTVTTELHDLLLAYGYDLGIGAEAEDVAELRLDEMDRTRAWETVVGLCQASTNELTELFSEVVRDLVEL